MEVLYPNDNHVAGKELRLKQQYFFVSASVQRALARYKKNHDDIRRLPEKVTFQLNDTHPTVTVAESRLGRGVGDYHEDLCLHQPYDHGGSTGKMAD